MLWYLVFALEKDVKHIVGHENLVSFDDREPPSVRSFGITIAAVLAVIGFWPLIFRHSSPRYAILGFAAAFLILALLRPGLLGPLNRVWFKFGNLLHRIVNPLVLGLLFVCVMTPIALMLRFLGKKLIPLEFDADCQSYWINREPPGPPGHTMDKQF